MEAPTAANEKIIDYIANGFWKVFSQLDEVMKLDLPPELMDGGTANLEEIQKLLGVAQPTF